MSLLLRIFFFRNFIHWCQIFLFHDTLQKETFPKVKKGPFGNFLPVKHFFQFFMKLEFMFRCYFVNTNFCLFIFQYFYVFVCLFVNSHILSFVRLFVSLAAVRLQLLFFRIYRFNFVRFLIYRFIRYFF